jgi:hypothetical protein
MIFTPKSLLSEELEGEESVWIFILFELKEYYFLAYVPF